MFESLAGSPLRGIVATFVLLSPSLLPISSEAAAQEPIEVVSVEAQIHLEEAISMALTRNPGYAQAEISLENAFGSERTARGAFLPSLSVSSGTTLSSSARFDPATERQVTGSSQSLSGGLSLGYDLFTGGRNRAELERAGIETEAADVRLEGQRFEVIFRTKQAFFDALRHTDLVAVAESRVQRAEENLELVRRRVEMGSATASDSLRTRLELANARQTALQSRNQLRSARMALGRQVGISGPVDAVRPSVLEPSPLPLTPEEIYELAETRSPSVRAAELSRAADQAQVASARASYLPSLRIGSGYDWSNQDWAFDGGRTSWRVSLSVSYPIFNGFVRETNVQRAQSQVRLAQLVEEDARLEARQAVDHVLQGIHTAEEAIALAEEAVLVAREDLRVVQERYVVGVATVFEVVTSQVALDQAEADRVTARYDYLLARAELEAILGREL